MKISNENRDIAKNIAEAFCARPSVNRYWDDSKISYIDILECENSPNDGVTSYGTIGLSDHVQHNGDGNEFPLRLELVGTCYEEFYNFPNILSTAVFYIVHNNWFCTPGSILENVIDIYEETFSMKHLFFTSPFLWDKTLKTSNFGNKQVAWLLVVPISESEREYARKYGSESLEDLFEENQIDIFNLNRDSII